MSVYDGLETSSWLGQNPAVTESLNRLKQLEELRKQRELQTREKLASIRSNRNFGSLRKSSLTDNETGSRFLRRAPSSSDDESTIPAYRSGDITTQLGGARPKLSSSISRDETNIGLGGEHDQWFSGVAESILGPSFTSRQLSPRKSMRNDRFTFSEDSDRSSKVGSLSRDSLARSSFQGTLGQPSSRASKGSNNLFDGVLESAFSEGIIAPKISNLRRNFDDNTHSDFHKPRGFASSKIDSNRVFTNSNNVNSKEYGGQEPLNDNSPNGQYDISEESHIEESQHQEGENKTKMEEEEEEELFDDPLEFSQSLKNFRNSNEIHCDNFLHNDNSAHKRAAHSGLLVSSVPTVPPLKKVKSVDLEDVNSDQYSDLPDMIHTDEDLTSVAKDIVATFSQPFSPDGLGPRSPSYKENVGAAQIRSGYDFSKSQPEILDENGHLKVPDFSAVSSDDQNDNLDSEKATFTSQSHNNIVRRTSSSKKKKRPPSFHRKGESEQNSDSENKMEKKTSVAVNGKDVQDSSATGFEQFTIRLTGLSGSDGPLVSVDTVQEEQNNGNKDGRVEHLGILHVTDSLYRSGSSEWVVINQDGQSDGKTDTESEKGVQVNGGESNSLISNPDTENEKSIVSGSGLRRKLYSKGSQSQSSIDSQTLSPSAPEKKGLIARWKNMFGSFGHSDVTSEFNLSNDTSDCVDETRLDLMESADQSVQPALIEERKVWTDENGSNDVARSDDFQSADSSPRSDKGVLGRSSVAYAVMSDSDEAFETASDDSGNNRDRKKKAKDMKETKTAQMSSVSEVKENFGYQSEATEQSENTTTQNSTDFQQIGLLQAQDHYKSPGDILGNLREIRRFVHKSVSEPGTSEELSAQLNKTDASKLMVDAQTMTDASLTSDIMQQHRPKLISTCAQTESEVILKDSGQLDDRELYQCPHCGKMSGICSSPENQEKKDSGAGKSRGYMRGTASCHVKNNIRKSVSNPLKNSEKDSNKPPIPNGKSSPTPQREKRRPSYSKNDSDGCSSKNRPSTPVSSTPSYMRSTSATRLKEIDKSEPDLRMKRAPSRASSICDGEELSQMSHMNKKQSKSLNQLEFSNQDFQTLKMPEVVPKPRSPQTEKAAEDLFFLGNVSSLTAATSALIEKAFQDSKQDQNNQDQRPDQCEISTENETSSQSSNQTQCANHTDSVAETRDKLDKSDSVHVTDGKNSSNFKTSGKPKLSGPKQSEIPALKKSNKAGKFSTPDSQHTRSPVKKPAEFKGCSKLAGTNDDDVDSTSQFTTIVDNPFIKNDAQCREGLKMKTGPGPNKSVWSKSSSANQEREKCADSADLKPIDSGSKETIETSSSCDASVKEESVKIANQELEQNIFFAVEGADECQDKKHGATLCRTVSMEKEDMQKIHSSSSVLYGCDDVHSAQDVNVMHQVSEEQTQPHDLHKHGAGIAGIQRFKLPAGQKPNAIVVETDVDAAFEEYKALKSGSVDNGGRASSGGLENVDHVAFAEKACSKLLGSDTFVDIYKLEKNSKQQNEELDFPDTVVKELQHSPRQSISSESSSHSSSMTSEYSTDTSSIGPTSPIDPSDRKQGKKSKSKKGFFKGFLSNSTKQDNRPKERSSTNTPGSSSPLPSREREVASQYPVETPASIISSKTTDAETSKPPLVLTSYLDATPLEQNDVTVFSNTSETPDSAPSQQSEIKSTAPQINVNHGNEVKVSNQDGEGEEEEFHARINLKNWDPSKLLKELYKVTLMPDNIEDISYKFVTMEGLMEKLPMNKKKATLLKTWKRRFFKATDGWLHYYETSNRDKPSDSIQLMGGKIENLGNRVIGVDDGRGRFLMVRAPSDREHGQWILAMESQTADNVKATYVRPALSTPPHINKRVLILDIGSCGIRAGILGESPCLPTLFFPSIVAEDKQSGELFIGIDSFKPEVRHKAILKYPVLPTNKVDKFNIDMEVMPKIISKVLKELSLNPKTIWVMIGTPQNLGDKLKEGLMKILVDDFHTKGVCMVQQSLLALYSYRTDSGIIVDIGNRMEILPIYEAHCVGYSLKLKVVPRIRSKVNCTTLSWDSGDEEGVLIEGGVARQVCGGQKVADSLHISLMENKYKFSTPVEKLIVRYIMEKSCYVVDNYSEAKKKCDADPDNFRTTVSLSNFDLPEGAHMSVTHDYSCFKSAEGLFNTDLWGIDYPSIQKLVFQAIQACPMDSRKHMYRSIYLSGGVTMLPGFAERLQTELKKLAPPSVVVEVHASPQRYHSAYIGACALAGMDIFEKSCISAEEWRHMGTKAFRKWSTSSSS